jgi:hypothetical protein
MLMWSVALQFLQVPSLRFPYPYPFYLLKLPRLLLKISGNPLCNELCQKKNMVLQTLKTSLKPIRRSKKP